MVAEVYKRDFFSQVYEISTHYPRVPVSRPDFRRFLFALWFFFHFLRLSPNPIPITHLQSTKCRRKALFRVFRDFHSVPAKRSNVPTGTLSDYCFRIWSSAASTSSLWRAGSTLV